jgi:hypothetical protein
MFASIKGTFMLCAPGRGLRSGRGARWRGDEPDPAKILDLAMLVVPGGQERSEDEYRVLLEKSGFRLTRVIPTRTPSGSIIEAIPV